MQSEMAEQKDWEEVSTQELCRLQEGILRESSIHHLQCGVLVSVEVGEVTTRFVSEGSTTETLRNLRGDVQTEDSIPSILWTEMLGIEPQKASPDCGLSAMWK
jgi:hypothetical protein